MDESLLRGVESLICWPILTHGEICCLLLSFTQLMPYCLSGNNYLDSISCWSQGVIYDWICCPWNQHWQNLSIVKRRTEAFSFRASLAGSAGGQPGLGLERGSCDFFFFKFCNILLPLCTCLNSKASTVIVPNTSKRYWVGHIISP